MKKNHSMNPTRRACVVWPARLAAFGLLMRWGHAGAQAHPRVVASFSILADMVREVAPADFEVTALVGPDADAHVFEPTPADGRRLAQTGLVVVNGLGFEGWLDRLVRASGYRGAVVVASTGISPRHGAHHGADPHAWQDLAHAQRYVQTLADAMAVRWPERTAELQARAADYRRRLGELDARVRGSLEAVPREQRRVITAHDAFGYFGAAYGVDFLAPRGWTTSSEPSAAAVARLIRQVREQRVRALFLENISDPRLMQRIAQESGARIGGTLFSDALSDATGPAPTYIKLFEHNARTLAEALGS
jgi:zinc/manganese transport system substrate-binding protein